MALDPEFLNQLINTFKVELDENLQIIVDGLIALESHRRDIDSNNIINEIFRAAHNIKGSAHTVGVKNVGDIAHHIEAIFSSIKHNVLTISTNLINICLSAVDGMKLAMQAFDQNKPLNFSIDDLLGQLVNYQENVDERLSLPAKKTQSQILISEDPTPLSSEISDQSIASQATSAIEKPTITENYQARNFDTIRVPIKQIDHVYALLEEMQLNKIVLSKHYSELTNLHLQVKQAKRSHHSDTMIDLNHIQDMRKHLGNTINEMNSLVYSLQEEVRRLRLIPAASLFRTLNRVTRDLAQELNKKVELKLHGDQIKIDKVILENLKDPLIHLIRNAIDHGIEPSDIRIKNGKPEVGTITIKITNDGNLIFIEIHDDGAGIDTNKILKHVKNLGLVNDLELAKMSSKEIVSLIFKPGFSTKEVISEISGRGVGLDVVKTNLELIHGEVKLTTCLGKGTTFSLELPLTLSSDVGLIVMCMGQEFVLPTSNIEHVLSIKIDDIIEVEGKQTILFNNTPVPLFKLSEILNINESEFSNEQLHLVILKKNDQLVALVVDSIINRTEIVIKPLNPPLQNIKCVAGGTLSGRGNIILVLNGHDLINAALSSKFHYPIIKQDVKKPFLHILLADDSITTRTLEKTILENQNYKVTVAANGAEAWILLQHNKFDLVITDIEMPQMDGFELTKKIKTSESLQDLPVIIVTSLGNEQHKQQGLNVGADAYIVKHEFESEKLLHIITQLV